MFPVIANPAAMQNARKVKITCATCKLRGCVGRCRFEPVKGPKTAEGSLTRCRSIRPTVAPAKRVN